ncbi:sugar ABC transporter permease [Advenella sp. S44]|uniref:ABC transporter permease n=1 Tax=Advenella sp. S44 TaxID=1982755 RepID=UPI000C2A77EC|nr:ABC transporter permease [Advenella sp. S44]PJX25518.1 sugar ABC transporter permease [Advenella sp. S44]
MSSKAHSGYSPRGIATSLYANRALIFKLAKREVVGRYKGSFLGLFWSFVTPVIMLTVYTFVFSVVFKARWPGGSESKTEFALVLFSGLIIFNLFAETINRAPGLILSNSNYVKKVVFPLEILPVIALGSAFFHFCCSLIVWVIFYLLFFGIPPLTILYLPLILIPLMLLTLGLSWILSSLGVYLRDVSQIIGLVTTVLMFLSPIFYSSKSLPEKYQIFLHVSPLTFAVESVRNIMIWGVPINWIGWAIYMGVSFAIAYFGFWWFQKTRKGFADVI